MTQLPNRILSIDAFRAITMLLMIFVNDVSSVHHIPEWIEHVEADVDGMGFADTIFPAFLFIVGLSLPFAINSRFKRADSFLSILFYILLRSAALIIMGFFHVNMEDYSSAAALSRGVWTILVTVGFMLIWMDYSEKISKGLKYTLIGAGILLLLGMAYIYKGGDEAHGMQPSWWGILGIIGWAYLVCALIYLFCKGNLYVLLAVFLIFITINITNHMGILHVWLWLIDDASSVSLIMAGTVVSLVYLNVKGRSKDWILWTVLSIAGPVCILAGLLVRPYAGGISKISSTPAWVLICIGISILVFELMVYLVDLKGKQNWFKVISPAGTSTLTCYLIPYFLYSIFYILHLHYPHFFNNGAGGILRSFIIAFLVIFIVGWLEKKRIRLKI